jgi:membrane-bound lytic murein transglycosylase D
MNGRPGSLRAAAFLTSISFVLASFLLSGCASSTVRSPVSTPEPVPERTEPIKDVLDSVDRDSFEEFDEEQQVEDVLEYDAEIPAGEPLSESPLDALETALTEITQEAAEVQRERVEDQPPLFDVKIEVNKKVLGWVDYYSNKHKAGFITGLVRSGRYLEMFREIYAETGVPQDLVYMAHVESAYKTNAYSRAHAKGIYQFISATGRRYGLRIDWWVDERSDPEKSARASAAYLKDLHEEFGDWYLALAAYNAGEGKVRRAIRGTGSRDFWTIARTRYLRRETKNYVPAILAAILISKEPEKYGISFTPDPKIIYETIEVPGAADLRVLARCAGSDFETLKLLNPALRRFQTPPDGQTDVRVPAGAGEAALAALQNVPVGERVLYVRHRIRSGDTLSVIARKYRVSVGSIQSANNMGRRTMIREGKTLVIPTVAAGDYDYVPAQNYSSGDAVITYRVRRGDTLSQIARRYRTTAPAIAAASGIRVNKTLAIGQRVKVTPGVRSTTQARNLARGSGAAVASGRSVYVVRRGDSLWKIANRNGSTVNRLCSLNGLSKNSTLYPGMKLRLR